MGARRRSRLGSGSAAATRAFSVPLGLLLAGLLLAAPLRAQVAITELLASNRAGLLDEDRDRPDWIEVANLGEGVIDLDGWGLSDDPARPLQWRFPSFPLASGERIVVFASGKDRVDPAGRLHASFRLASGGEYLALHSPDGALVQELAPAYPPQRPDISYGMAEGGDPVPPAAARWVFFDRPTPGEPNPGDGILGFAADPAPSVDHGFFEAPFDLELRSASQGAEVRFTLDGSVPSAARGARYEGPLRIERTTVVRAIALAAGLEPSRVMTRSYLFLEDVIRQDPAATLAAGFPRAWGGTAPDYGMDPDVIGQEGQDRFGGRYAAAIRDDLLAVPTLSIVMNADDLFGSRGLYTQATQRGPAWERPCSVEWIRPDGRPGFAVDAGLRAQGGAFRSHGLTKKHSLRIVFRSRYGPSKLEYPLFGRGGATDRFETLTLRSGSNDGWQWDAAGSQPLYVRDEFARRTLLDMGGVASHGTFAHVYLNGFYWGLYNPVERPDAAFCAAYFGGEEEEWDSINHDGPTQGDQRAWSRTVAASRAVRDLAGWYAIQGLGPDGSDDPALEEWLDPGNFADYMIVNLWAGNTDWPHKNFWMGRRRVESSGFKFFPWDTEWSLGLRSNVGTNQTGVSSGIAAPWPGLKQSAEFRLLVADRLERALAPGGALHVDEEHPEWDPDHPERNVPAARFVALTGEVEQAVVAESARWGDQHRSIPYTRDADWARERDGLLQGYFPRRSAVVRDQFRAGGLYPRIDPPLFSQPPGLVRKGSRLLLSARRGEVYYTLDGNDPRLAGGEIAPSALAVGLGDRALLLSETAPVRALVPADDSLGLEWTDPDFDDSAWNEGPGGVGYDGAETFRPFFQTDVEPWMRDINPSVYVRVAFDLDESQFQGGRLDSSFLILGVRYDDGYFAWLNGVEVARANTRGEPEWDSRASRSHPDALARELEEVDLAARVDLLHPGRNVLALQGLNVSKSSQDFLLAARLESVPGVEGLRLDRSLQVRARAFDGDEWSALAVGDFTIDVPLRPSEVAYHPAPPPEGSPFGASDFEFVELRNTGAGPIRLDGLWIGGGIRFDFSRSLVSELPGGGILLVVRNLEAFASRHDTRGLLIAGEYDGRLDNDRDRFSLRDAGGGTIFTLEYDDTWFPETDGEGPSLVAADTRADPSGASTRAFWRPSDFPDGSPGLDESDPRPAAGRQLPGDLTQDGRLDITDPVRLLRALFLGDRRPPPCGGESLAEGGNLPLADSSGDGKIDLADAIHVLQYLFLQGPPPAAGTGCIEIEGCPDACRR